MKSCLFQHSDGSMSATITAIRLSPLHLRGCAGAVKLKSELENGGADVVEVTRCKDCKHYIGLAECEFVGHFSGGTNYFCADGERKSG